MERKAHFLVDSRKIHPNFDLEELTALNDLIDNRLGKIEQLEKERREAQDIEKQNKINEKLPQLWHEVEERKKDREAVLEAGQLA